MIPYVKGGARPQRRTITDTGGLGRVHPHDKKKRNKTHNPREGWEDGTATTHDRNKRNKTRHPREGWEDGTPPPHRDFRGEVWC